MRFRTLLTAPLVALALGCGSGGSGAGVTAPAGATVIKAIEGIAWDAKTYSAAAVDGKVTIALLNDSSLPHDLRLLDADNVDVGLVLITAKRGEVHTRAYTLGAGAYLVFCSIAGHGNMKATLTVN
jgi:plastocyanin